VEAWVTRLRPALDIHKSPKGETAPGCGASAALVRLAVAAGRPGGPVGVMGSRLSGIVSRIQTGARHSRMLSGRG